ncbi:MnhB domain-containing protein [Phytoactinopolyspora halotolerans]|uniref:Cation transporter n=1 Tax=Phytoactinopolyspora halotolerans TaxID=1981512 RepID=A0A6L9SA77_9ACTN|nr:MnhB domain-containing protein [Phytoactinopolyspora halotolerans]NEE02009.1 cation transporter [Phytoactinopolyspora halotolerans]
MTTDRTPHGQSDKPQPGRQEPRQRLLPAAHHEPPTRRSVLLEVVTRVLYPSVLVVAAYMVVAGEHRTGGGFPAGLVVGAGLSLRFLAGGPHEFGSAMPINPASLLGTGLAVMAGYGLVGELAGDGALSSTTWSVDLPVFGHLEGSTAMIFDAGVAILVVGLVVDVLRVMGPGVAPDDQEPEEEDQP